jgi:hypothetical protein
MQYRAQMALALIFLASLSTGCDGDDAAVAEKANATSPPPGTTVAAEPATKSNNEAGPKFCGKIRPAQIMAAFEFGLTLAEVDFADETECRYKLDVPGAQVAMLIYRIHPVTMYEMYKDSSQKTADLPNLGEEAILLGNAHIEVKLDKERALEVSLSIDNTSGGFSMTPEKVTERLAHFAYLLSVRL